MAAAGTIATDIGTTVTDLTVKGEFCVPCRARGHACYAHKRVGREAWCIHCLDEEPCVYEQRLKRLTVANREPLKTAPVETAVRSRKESKKMATTAEHEKPKCKAEGCDVRTSIFVGDMFDLFHEAIPVEFIERVWDVMRRADQHTFQVLTKRAQRLRGTLETCKIPIWNIWVGVSVENQKYADERIPLLLKTPAAVRFLSVEPMLEAVTMDGGSAKCDGWWVICPHCDGTCSEPSGYGGGKPCSRCFGKDGSNQGVVSGIDWVICGGESGSGARPFNLAWAESLLKQCQAAGVPFFMKQVGSHARRWMSDGETLRFPTKDRKGGSMEEWPESLRVRQFPSPQMELVK